MLLRIKTWLNQLSRSERYFFLICVLIFITGFVWILKNLYEHITIELPAYGGELKEGMIGQPANLNPLIPVSDTDNKINELIYDGLFRIEKDGRVAPELAKNYSVSDNKLTYTINLRPNVYWQDGQQLNSDDVVFTFNSILNQDLRSPLSNLFQGVSVDKIDQQTVEFHLARPYSGFLINLTKAKIIPRHIWENIPTLNWAVSDYDKKPIGSGPYVIDSLEKDNSGIIRTYNLTRNENYFLKKPYLQTIRINFYQTQDDLRKALNSNEIDSTSDLEPNFYKDFAEKKSLVFENYVLPRYFTIFFNLSKFKDAGTRRFIDNVINKNLIVKDFFGSRAEALNQGPFSQALLSVFKLNPNDIASTSLAQLPLPSVSFTLTVPDTNLLQSIGQEIKQELSEKNFQVNLEMADSAKLNNTIIKNKNFDALLFGEAFDLNFDLFSLWDSGQKDTNLSGYKNKNVDATLEEMKLIQNPQDLAPDVKFLATTLKNDAPAVFLFNPYLVYIHKSFVHGPETHTILDRENDYFSDIENWYVKTSRILK